MSHWPYLCVPLVGKRGGVAYVSESAWELVHGIRWYLGKNGYATSMMHGNMHRRLMVAEPSEEVDHINFNRLDNRNENLQCCHPSINRMRCRKKSTSPWPYKGVRCRDGRWQARITTGKKTLHLGTHATPEAAALAYDSAARKHFGRQAVCNFEDQ